MRLINYRFKRTNHFTADEVQRYTPMLAPASDELWAIMVKHRGYLMGIGEVEPAEESLTTDLAYPTFAIRENDSEEEEEELDRGSVIINEVVIPPRATTLPLTSIPTKLKLSSR